MPQLKQLSHFLRKYDANEVAHTEHMTKWSLTVWAGILIPLPAQGLSSLLTFSYP